jgi:cell shape-determining protein MreC
MASRQIRASNLMLFILLLLAAGIIFIAPLSWTKEFQSAFNDIFSWPLRLGTSVSLSARTQEALPDVFSRGQYNSIQNHLANIMQQLYQEHQKVEKLSGLRNRLPLEGADLVVADVIRATIDGQSELIINRGKNDIDNLAKDQFVLGDNSVIGTISDVSSRTAKVRLFTDPAFKIAVKIGKLDIDRVMQGDGGKSATVRMIKQKVKTGEEVFARKKPGLLDAPMIIGKVADCKKNKENPLLWDITVEPACDIEALNEVAVIIMNP